MAKGKKGNRGKKGKKGKKGQTIVKQFDIGRDEFHFPNQDVYEGQYVAHYSGLVWREGRGIYQTNDGQQYEGTWYADKLHEKKDNHIVRFPNEDQYIGGIKKNKYNGNGSYHCKNGVLYANFVKNKPKDNVIFVDYRGTSWFGIAQAKEVIMAKDHVFWSELDNNYGRGTEKHPPVEEVEDKAKVAVDEEEQKFTDKELEKILFAPYSKIPLGEEESCWYKDYQRSLELEDSVKQKMTNKQELTVEELVWYETERRAKKILERYTKTDIDKKELIKQYFMCQQQGRHIERENLLESSKKI